MIKLIIFVIFNLLLSVSLHEMGHFIAAIICKCTIEKVSIGFGKPFLKWKFKGITFQITPHIYLGGYVSLEGESKYINKRTAFSNLPYRKKLLISVAGVTANFLLGIIYLVANYFYKNIWLLYAGHFNILLGLSNLFPLIPCLDGGYCLYIPILFKIFGKEKGYEIFFTIQKITFIILMTLQVLLVIIIASILIYENIF